MSLKKILLATAAMFAVGSMASDARATKQGALDGIHSLKPAKQRMSEIFGAGNPNPYKWGNRVAKNQRQARKYARQVPQSRKKLGLKTR